MTIETRAMVAIVKLVAPTSLSHVSRSSWGVESSRMKTTSVTFNLFAISSAYK